MLNVDGTRRLALLSLPPWPWWGILFDNITVDNNMIIILLSRPLWPWWLEGIQNCPQVGPVNCLIRLYLNLILMRGQWLCKKLPLHNCTILTRGQQLCKKITLARASSISFIFLSLSAFSRALKETLLICLFTILTLPNKAKTYTCLPQRLLFNSLCTRGHSIELKKV